MPTLQLTVSPSQTPERCQQLATALTELTAQLLGKRAGVTAVTIHSLPGTHWFVGGDPVGKPAAMLDIAITQGTNTAVEKAAFVAAVFAELQQQLTQGVDLHEASYITVREVPATDWGYGGVTQAGRKLAADALPAPITSPD